MLRLFCKIFIIYCALCYIFLMNIIEGKTVAGQKLGSRFGFPTVNMLYNGAEKGVFAGKLFFDGKWHIAAINIGVRPTVDNATNLCEAFLLNWQGNIPEGSMVKVELGQRIRDTKKFLNFDELKAQIAKDVEFVKTCYNVRS